VFTAVLTVKGSSLDSSYSRGVGARIFEFSTNSVLHRKENSVMRSA
jgi:hypothetical protein